MTDSPKIAAATTLLGQLQRGRGAGFRAALAAGPAARDAVLQCIVDDPRRDLHDESRERYYAELLVALDVPIDAITAHLRSRDGALGHGVLAGAWRLGHGPTRQLLAADGSDRAVVEGVALQLWNFDWARMVELDGVARLAFLRAAVQGTSCAESQRRTPTGTFAGTGSLDDLLELGRQMPKKQQWAIIEELCRRGSEEDRAFLDGTVRQDPVYARVVLAAQALGTLGDERLLETIERQFAREDVLADPLRRLPADERMRRTGLSEYVRHLPIDRQLELARAWHGRGAFFTTMANQIFGARATPDDREAIEAAIERSGVDGTGHEILNKLLALGRIADPRSAPLLLQVVEEATSSAARQRALEALATMPDAAGVQAAMHESLWDCEDAAIASACSALATFDQPATQRAAMLGELPLLDAAVRERVAERVAKRTPET